MSEQFSCPNVLNRFAVFGDNIFINSEVIYWHLQDITTDFEGTKVIESFRGCFAILQPYFHPIRFESTADINQANIIIHFAVNGDSDLPQPFGPSTLAYAFSPVRNKSNIWFNDDHNWGEMHTNNTFNLKKVAVHECLHSLGLGHSSQAEWPGDILNPVYTRNNDILITQDTVDGINHLYGELKDSIEDTDGESDIDKELERLRALLTELKGELTSLQIDKTALIVVIDKIKEDIVSLQKKFLEEDAKLKSIKQDIKEVEDKIEDTEDEIDRLEKEKEEDDTPDEPDDPIVQTPFMSYYGSFNTSLRGGVGERIGIRFAESNAQIIDIPIEATPTLFADIVQKHFTSYLGKKGITWDGDIEAHSSEFDVVGQSRAKVNLYVYIKNCSQLSRMPRFQVLVDYDEDDNWDKGLGFNSGRDRIYIKDAGKGKFKDVLRYIQSAEHIVGFYFLGTNYTTNQYKTLADELLKKESGLYAYWQGTTLPEEEYLPKFEEKGWTRIRF